MPGASPTVLFFIKGSLIGLSIAAPVGPIGLLCIRRSLADGRAMGLATGVGAATADAAYGAIAAFGLTSVSSVLVGQRFWLGLLGGIFLCYLGILTFRAKPPAAQEQKPVFHVWTAYWSSLILTVTNPATILSFAAVFAGLGLGATGDYWSASGMVLGVFVGSAVWWLFLSSGVSFFRERVTTGWMQRINRISGSIIVTLGITSIWRAFYR